MQSSLFEMQFSPSGTQNLQNRIVRCPLTQLDGPLKVLFVISQCTRLKDKFISLADACAPSRLHLSIAGHFHKLIRCPESRDKHWCPLPIGAFATDVQAINACTTWWVPCEEVDFLALWSNAHPCDQFLPRPNINILNTSCESARLLSP